eukprot:NODE_1066_length_2351_cov_0.355240.p2 type:complete len:100 gc:universal NODE_1066_length_2351_cov_0.355240:1550-1251(-)
MIFTVLLTAATTKTTEKLVKRYHPKKYCGLNSIKQVRGYHSNVVFVCHPSECCSAFGFCGKSDPSITTSKGFCNHKGDYLCAPAYSGIKSDCQWSGGPE